MEICLDDVAIHEVKVVRFVDQRKIEPVSLLGRIKLQRERPVYLQTTFCRKPLWVRVSLFRDKQSGPIETPTERGEPVCPPAIVGEGTTTVGQQHKREIVGTAVIAVRDAVRPVAD